MKKAGFLASIFCTAVGMAGRLTSFDPQSRSDLWHGRHERDMRDPETAAAYHEWMSRLDAYKDAPLREKAEAVDGAVDLYMTYKEDKKNFWQSPAETLRRKTGDCEDFSVLKYYALRYLGVGDDACAIIVGKSPTGVHAVTTVKAPDEAGKETPFILDNQDIAGVAMPLKNKKFKPYYAVNTTKKPFRVKK